MDLIKIETELKKRWFVPYDWGKIQDNRYDRLTDFIYSIVEYDKLIDTADRNFGGREDYTALKDYALNRWYNFWSAMALEHIFAASPHVKAEADRKNRFSDFEIGGIKFDLKTSVFPAGYGKTLAEARNDPYSLILWLYENQSRERRMHYKNRLFLVLFSRAGQHWKLKAEIDWLKTVIDGYTAGFEKQRLYHFCFDKKEITLSDIIFAVK